MGGFFNSKTETDPDYITEDTKYLNILPEDVEIDIYSVWK